MVYWQIICGTVVAWQIVNIYIREQSTGNLKCLCESFVRTMWKLPIQPILQYYYYYIVCNVNFWYANIALYV